MSTKDEIIKLLQEYGDRPLSGGAAAEKLGVSRTAVWKAIRSLQEEGYLIEASAGKGYTLKEENDVVSEAALNIYAAGDPRLAFHVYQTVDSTNDVLREEAAKGAPEGTVIVAAEQSKGKGRRGKSFFSPEGSGIYFSILLRPGADPSEAGHFTTMAAVAVSMALEEEGVKDQGIKWVNDVYAGGKKICGILSEGVSSLETGLLEEVIIGIGINIYEPRGGFPPEIRNVAGSVLKDVSRDARSRIAARTCVALYGLYRDHTKEEIYELYRERCFVPGKKISVIRGGDERQALALGLDEECRLIVRYEDDGSEETLSSGEISIKV